MARPLRPAARRAVSAGALGVVGVVLGFIVVLGLFGGVPRVMVTSGSSMQPVLAAGDLVMLARGQGCEVGEVSAYAKEDTVFLHRVLAVEGGRCVLKGDANDWIDPDRPLPQDMLGTLVLRVPGAGGWWAALTSSRALAALAFVLVASGGSGRALRRSRRTRRLAAAPAGPALRLPARSWATGGATPVPASEPLHTPPRVRSTAGLLAVAVLVVSAATALVPLAGSEPAVAEPAAPRPVAAPMAGPRTVTFSYSAQVRDNDVYDTALARSPLPVFRALGQQVQVRAGYAGAPAELGLALTMTSPTGWSRTLALTTPVAVTDGDAVEALLDLPDLQAQAQRVAAQTRMPFEGLHLDLVAHLRSATAPAWSPALGLELSPTALRLSGEPATLVVQEATAAGPGSAPPASTPASRLASVLTWRPDPLLFGLVAAVLVGVGALLRARRQDESDLARAHRVLGSLVLPVEPVPLDGVRVVDVAGPEALVRLAERYGLLVLHWTAADAGVFLVHDESTAYRYRAGGTTSLRAVEPVLEVATAETVVLVHERAEQGLAAEAERVVQRLQQEHAAVAWSVQVQRLVPAQRQDLDALAWD